MKKILAFLALASLAQVSLAVDYDTAAALTSGTGTVISATGTTGAANTCSILSNAEPPVTINLSRDVVAALRCNTGSNAAGAATQHPGGRPAACNSNASRCAYVATTAGGPVSAVTGQATPTGASLTTCAGYISGLTGGTVSASCQ